MQTSRIHAALAAILGSERAASATIVVGNTAPPAMVAYQLMGFTPSEWSAIAGTVFTLMLIIGKLYQFFRWAYRSYVHHRAQRALLARMLPASTTPADAAKPAILTPDSPAFRQPETLP